MQRPGPLITTRNLSIRIGSKKSKTKAYFFQIKHGQITIP